MALLGLEGALKHYIIYMHVQLKLDELEGPQTLGSL
jgi:hypothetical protein